MKINKLIELFLLLSAVFFGGCREAERVDCDDYRLPVINASSVELTEQLNYLHAYAEENLYGLFDSSYLKLLSDCLDQLKGMVTDKETVLMHVRANRLRALHLQNEGLADSSLILLVYNEGLLDSFPLGIFQYYYEYSYNCNLVAAAHALRHNYALSLHYYQRSLGISQRAGASAIELAKDYSNLSETYYYLGRSDLANAYSDTAAYFINSPDLYLCTTGDSLGVWGYWFHRGKIKFQEARRAEIRGDIDLRDSLLRMSRRAFMVVEQGLNQMSPEQVVNNLVYLYVHTGNTLMGGGPSQAQLDTARWYFERALLLSPGNPLLELMIKPAIAYVHSMSGQCALALAMADSVQASFPPQLERIPPGPSSLLFYAYHQMAMTRKRCEGNFSGATPAAIQQSYETSLSLFEEMQRNLGDSESLENWSGNLHNYYLPPFEHVLSLYQKQPSDTLFELLLQVSERGKSVELYRGLSRKLAQQQWTGRRRQLLDRELLLNKQINNCRTSGELSSLDAALRAMTVFVDSLRDSNDPLVRSFYLERHARIRPRLSDLRSTLCRPGVAVVSFQQGEGCLYALLFTKDRDTVLVLPADGEFYKDAEAYRRSLAAEEGSLYRSVAYDFYRQLFAPIDIWLGRDVNEVLIVWDKELHGLVLEALPTGLPAEKRWQDIPYLLDRYAFSYSYSLASLQAGISLHKLRPTPDGAATFTVKNATEDLCGAVMPELKSLQRALTHASGLTQNRHFAESNKEIFVQNAAYYRLLQLGMHGCQPNTSEEAYFLVFRGDTEKARLSEVEVQNLDLQADLVILATCLNAKGSNYTSEGRKSLARAFLYAGSQAVLASNEYMHEAMLVELLQHLYRISAAQHLPIGKALQQAKRSYIAAHNHNPYYWANWLLIGNPAVYLVDGG